MLFTYIDLYIYISNIYIFIFIDRRGIVTPEYRAEQERVGGDSVITNNKTYGTVKIVQPQVLKYLLISLYYIYIYIMLYNILLFIYRFSFLIIAV